MLFLLVDKLLREATYSILRLGGKVSLFFMAVASAAIILTGAVSFLYTIIYLWPS